MSFDDQIKLLSMVDVLEPLSHEELADLARRLPVIEFERDQTLYTPTYRADTLFILLKGQVRIYQAVGGRELTLDIIDPHTIFGEAVPDTQLQNVYGNVWAQTTRSSSIALIKVDVFGRLVMSNPEVGLRAIQLLGRRLYVTANRMADIALKEVPARLASTILHLIEREGLKTAEGFSIPTRHTHRQLGMMIGADRVAVTRAFNILREAGAVKLDRRQICIKDIKALKRLAEGGGPGPSSPSYRSLE